MPNGYGAYIKRGDHISKGSRFVLLCDHKEILINVPNYHRPDIKNASGPFTTSNSEIDFIDLSDQLPHYHRNLLDRMMLDPN